MKTSSLVSMFFVGAALTLGSAGCVHKPGAITPIPDGTKPVQPQKTFVDHTGDLNPGGTIPSREKPSDIEKTDGGLTSSTNQSPWSVVIANGTPDITILKADTIYFDLDSATIKKSEEKKLEAVAAFLKAHQADALRVEGNCDERGTEKYNLSLGDRRALAAREYLANLNVDPRQVVTVTYGKAKPAAQGHNEAAWSKNRRDDFVVLIPKD
jgi:peptidoglycan-associated lipoprotein